MSTITIPIDEYVRQQANEQKAKQHIAEIESLKAELTALVTKSKMIEDKNIEMSKQIAQNEIHLTEANLRCEIQKVNVIKVSQEKQMAETRLKHVMRDYGVLKHQYEELTMELSDFATLVETEETVELLDRSEKEKIEKEREKKPRRRKEKGEKGEEKEKKKKVEKSENNEKTETADGDTKVEGENIEVKCDIYDDETDTIDDFAMMGVKDDIDETEELSTSVLFKNPQKCVFSVNYNLVIEVMKNIIDNGKNVARIKGFPSILAVDVFKEYTKMKNINIYDGIKGEKERKNHLRYNVGSFNKCLKKLEDARVKKGLPETIRVVTSCYVYIQCIGDQFRGRGPTA
ncbi:hypothetical protein EIN_296820 [Entamoeba invadens IP1]|uniref:Uncharacterized protein n=1 Tax=Entamoeba invadens IP1 TaxID=370355 RepID=L7FL77_ENTIV|nr:hypothetical protein EIN_296820 [Entamoeba invadens IP1]ELP86362.1 hypothetical protein EIN_296820 [Entamoeba invadens IP1]|eukprot:XP_004185708.1 hypothetical protein EIN_296820 [Entamoeba invadens IP1]